jgi:cobalt/nickel transport system permease protein
LHIHFLDPYRPRSSPLHRLDPRVKFVLVVAFIFTSAMTPVGAWPVYILLLSLVLAAEILSGLGVGYVLRRAWLAFPFVLAALPLIFTTPGSPFYSFSFLHWELVVTYEGLVRFTSLALKSWISVQAAILLAASTPFPDLMVAMRAVKIPRLLVAIFGLMWRYLFVLADEALRLLRARAARSGHADKKGSKPGGSLAWRASIAGGMAGNLLMRALERSDRIYLAMLSRGYDGEIRTSPLPSLLTRDILVLASGLGLLALLLLLSFLVGG